MDLQLDNQRVVITGGASGIGLATAQLFLEERAQVAIWDRQPLTPQATAALDACGQGRWLFCQVDVTQPATLAAAWTQTVQRLGGVEHSVHAAAIGSGKFGFPFSNLRPKDWPRVLEVNIMGMVQVAHCIAPELQRQGRGTLTFLASVAGQIGSQTDPPYSASKAANINFAQCLAKDLASSGVRVNVVNPGMVRTTLNKSVWSAWRATQDAAEPAADSPPSAGQSYESWAEEKIRKLVPLARWQSVEDVANAIVFLASSRAANITGQCLNVDGGLVMHS
ncbi:MAG: SDR family oxidoreductase [Planctomycetales bacterium]|nr:SDR family oxidoreductase [Planctomycetales bacterium]